MAHYSLFHGEEMELIYGVWLAIEHGVAELDTTERLITATHERKKFLFVEFFKH